MKTLLILIATYFYTTVCQSAQPNTKMIVTSDIENFWIAYDKITSTDDPKLQMHYLDELYLNRGTEGLGAIREARNYTSKSYLEAINKYPKFWASVRKNTNKSNQFAVALKNGLEKFKGIYPSLKPANIYFTIGALRTNGTTLGNRVLIGAELAMADKNTITTEFPAQDQARLSTYFDSNPIDDLVLLNIHEYVHTQQKTMVHNLLSLAIYEGVAEFVSIVAMGVPSAVPAIEFGKKNEKQVMQKFEDEMFFSVNTGKWLWNGPQSNEFGIGELGYYVGYQMSENFYSQAENKPKAIRTLIELDFNNEKEIESFVDQTGVFSAPLAKLYQNFENSRATVTGIKQFKNNSQTVDPSTNQITVEFSEPLNGYHSGVDFGDLGKGAFPRNNVNGRFWGEDNKSWTISVNLEPNKHYQLLISNNFRTNSNIPLKPYLIDFKTGSKI